MSPQLLTLALLAAAAGVAIWRAVRHGRRGAAVWLQIPAAVFLYWVLYPPLPALEKDALTVLTEGATARDIRWLRPTRRVVALPEASVGARAESVPDLAYALRKYPEVRRLDVVGAGLPARDREASAGLAVNFTPSAGGGLVELQSPAGVLLGHEWTLRGRAAAPATGIELRDPSGAVVDAGKIDPGGAFALSAAARGEGRVEYQLRLTDATRAVIENVQVPLQVQIGQPLTLIIRAGAVNPELKYWRRWATDAGLRLALAETLTEGVTLRDGDSALDPARLDAADLVSIDARAWSTLRDAEKSALRAAVNGGLGLLLRIDGPVDQATAADWLTWGFRIAPAAPRIVTLDEHTSMHGRAAFSAAPAETEAAGGTPLLTADDGGVLAWQRIQGRGRVGLWLLLDSYRLALRGETARYASLWSDTLRSLARPHGTTALPPTLPREAWVNERIVFCGLGDAASVLTPAERSPRLLPDAAHCAAYWPNEPGWHRLRTAAGEWAFYVRDSNDGRGLARKTDGDATALLARTSDTGAAPTDAPSATADGSIASAGASERPPLARWPFLMAWLCVSAALWWRERRYRTLPS